MEIREEMSEVMALAKFEIRGLRPLLMSSAKSIIEPPTKKVKTEALSGHDPEVEAESRAYRDKEGYLVCPSLLLWSNITKAGRYFKKKTRTAVGFSIQEMLKGSIFIEPENPRLLVKGKETKKWSEIHVCSVVIPGRGRIPRYRPMIRDWSLIFNIRWDPELYGLRLEALGTAAGILDIVNRAGYLGLMDWRPVWGIYELVKWELLEK